MLLKEMYNLIRDRQYVLINMALDWFFFSSLVILSFISVKNNYKTLLSKNSYVLYQLCIKLNELMNRKVIQNQTLGVHI